jgi:TrmH family RNA methyltransferase
MGSAFRLPIVQATSATAMVEQARAAGLQVVAAVGHGHTPMHAVDFTSATLIVLGGEGQGLAPALVGSADLRVSIPMTPPVESLNVAVAAALLVYEARRQRESQSQRREGAKAR